MLTFILITIVLFLCLAYFGSIKRKNWAIKATLVFFAIFLTLAFILPAVSVWGADEVAKVPTDSWNTPTVTVYYDANEDVYFYVKPNLWNPLKINYRVPIDSEKMERYLEIQAECEEQLNQINIFE